jgi:hypothetical protein
MACLRQPLAQSSDQLRFGAQPAQPAGIEVSAPSIVMTDPLMYAA